MRPTVFLLVAVVRAAEPGYVDPALCQRCHREIAESYQQTGMGRSFMKVRTVPPLDGFFHERSQRRYSVAQRQGKYFLRRSPPDLETSIDYVIGSGNHSKTFLRQDARGRLIELPVSWYAEKGGTWGMSPGYDRPDHSDFRREISESCLFCHNGYPSEANGGLASGIDCQRCHGPGEAHVKGTGAIVNPAKLSPERRMEVCLQCHLESASRTLPDAIRRFGRNPFSYRPGEPLGDFTIYFEFANAPAEQRITVNGSAYRLMKSRCFARSGSRMQCGACHDPHRTLTGSEAEERYTRVCRSCHAAQHETSRRNCVACHMQKRRTEDAVHVVITDHLIRKRPIAGDQLAMREERHDRLSGPVKPLYPERLSSTPENHLYMAMAANDVAAIEAAIAAQKPLHADPYFALGEGFQRLGRMQAAIGAFRRAIELDPNQARSYVKASELMMETGDIDAAIAMTAPAVTRMPDDVALLNSLAVLYASKARFEDALPLLQRAVRVSEDDSRSWLNLGVCLEAQGDRGGAAAAYRRAVTLQPDFEQPREYLKRISK